jgi:hypothetical protein
MLTLNLRTKITPSTSRSPPYSSQNLTLPTPRTTHAIPPSLTTIQPGPVFVIIRNTPHILVMWQEAPLSTIHLLSPTNPTLSKLDTRVTKENSISNLDEKSSIVVVDVVLGPSFSFLFFLSGH